MNSLLSNISVLLGHVLITLQDLSTFLNCHILLSHCLIFFVLDHLLGFLSIGLPLLRLHLAHLSVSFFAHLNGLLHLLGFGLLLLSFHLFGHRLFVYCSVEVLGIIRLVLPLLLFLGLHIAIVHFSLVLNHSTPLIQISSLVFRVVAHLVILQLANFLVLKVERSLNSVRHLQRVHNRFSTSLHF